MLTGCTCKWFSFLNKKHLYRDKSCPIHYRFEGNVIGTSSSTSSTGNSFWTIDNTLLPHNVTNKEAPVHHTTKPKGHIVFLKNGRKVKNKDIVSGLTRWDASGLQETASSWPSLPITILLFLVAAASLVGMAYGITSVNPDALAAGIGSAGMLVASGLLMAGLGGLRNTSQGFARTKCIKEMIKFFDRLADAVEANDFLEVGSQRKIAIEIPKDAPDPVCSKHGKKWTLGHLRIIEGHAVIDNAAKVWARCPSCQPRTHKQKVKSPNSSSTEYDL